MSDVQTDDRPIEVKIEPDPVEVKEAPTEVKIEKSGEADPAVAELKAQYQQAVDRDKAREQQLADARRRENEARQEAQRARQEAQTAISRQSDSELDTITTGLAAAETQASAAEAEYKTAMEAGDYAAAAKAQRSMAKAEATSIRLTEAKADLETKRAARPAETTVGRVERRAPADPVEAYIEGRSEPTANWLREHREFITDPRKNAKLTAAHHDAVSDGLVPDTDEYFSHVEAFVGLRKAAEPAPASNGADKPKPARRSGPPVAPVNGSGGGAGGDSNVVRLTPGEARAATDGVTHVWGSHDLAAGRIKDKSLIGQAIGHQEMARRKREMERQGLYDKVYVES